MTTVHPVSPRTDPKQQFRQIEKIAVLTDFSPASQTALRFGASVARSYGARLVLAHAYLPPSSACSAPEAAMVIEAFDARRKSLEEELLGDTKEAWLRDLHCSTALCEGTPADLLQELKDVDLIVIGTSGGTGLEKALLGSTAEMVFRTSEKPVLTVGPHCRWTGDGKAALRTVLCAVESFSPDGSALSYALSLAVQHDAELVLLHVVEDKSIVLSAERAFASASTLEELRKAIPDGCGLKLKVKYLIDFGDAGEAILDEARIQNADVIVMGTHRVHRLPGIASRFAGGTAYRVAVNAACPVLTIRDRNGRTV